MNVRATLSAFILLALLAVPGTAAAQDTRYRVEVIVLTHLQHDEPPREVAALRDYGDAVDFRAPEPTEIEPTASGAAERADSEAPAETGPAEPDAALAPAEPPPLQHIEELGEVMQEAWRRLRLSGPFRPLLSLAWEQADEPPFPTLRVHDDTVVMSRDPWAPLRARLEAGEPVDAWLESGLVPPLPPLPPPTPTAEPAAFDSPEEELLARLPEPRLFYALDGTVSLERSRFLHLRIDLQQREAVFAAPPERPVLLPRGLRTMPAADPTVTADSGAEPLPTAFEVFEMVQSRQVRTGQVEYFDGPVLSVLAYVTAIEAPANGD